MAYVRWTELNGTIDDLDEINKAYMQETGNDEPWYDDEDEGWRTWIEHAKGKTYILAEIHDSKACKTLEEAYGVCGHDYDDLTAWSDEELVRDYMANSGIYTRQVLEEICRRADMTAEWDAADGETFERVVQLAAQELCPDLCRA